MRIVLATDAWEPQVNGVVRTLTRTVAECRDMGHEVEVIEPSLFKTIPCPTYPEIRLALGAEEEIREMLRAFEPEAVHIATEGPIGIATRRICVEWKLPFTTSYHTKFPEYISARFPVPVQVGYAYMKWFHKPSGRMMVATDTMREELESHGFRNISSWSRGVDTDLFHPRRPDEVDVFAGRSDGFDWKIVGKQEMLIPYNSNRLHTPLKDSDVLLANHLNPDHVRWELHRVYVVEATLKAGQRHQAPKSRYYVDEDTWVAVLGDRWDAKGQLWKTIWSHPVVMPDLPATTPQQQWGFNDLISGAWYASGVVNERNQHYKIVPRRPDSFFSPDAMAGEGVR